MHYLLLAEIGEQYEIRDFEKDKFVTVCYGSERECVAVMVILSETYTPKYVRSNKRIINEVARVVMAIQNEKDRILHAAYIDYFKMALDVTASVLSARREIWKLQKNKKNYLKTQSTIADLVGLMLYWKQLDYPTYIHFANVLKNKGIEI